MAITLTSNYKEVLDPQTVAFIEERIEDNYALDDMLEFIDEHNEDDFCNYYEEYVRCGEAIGYDAVDALIEEMGDMSYVDSCDERYRGSYDDEGEFAEYYHNEMGDYVPDGIVVDWDATWETNLRYDFTSCNDGTSYKSCHIFKDYWSSLDPHQTLLESPLAGFFSVLGVIVLDH